MKKLIKKLVYWALDIATAPESEKTGTSHREGPKVWGVRQTRKLGETIPPDSHAWGIRKVILDYVSASHYSSPRGVLEKMQRKYPWLTYRHVSDALRGAFNAGLLERYKRRAFGENRITFVYRQITPTPNINKDKQ